MPINHAKRREHNGSRSYEHVIRVITYRQAKTVSPKSIIIITFLFTFREAGRSSTRKHQQLVTIIEKNSITSLIDLPRVSAVVIYCVDPVILCVCFFFSFFCQSSGGREQKFANIFWLDRCRHSGALFFIPHEIVTIGGNYYKRL